jgi:hypothetical protein
MADAAGLIEQPHPQELLVVDGAPRLRAGTLDTRHQQQRNHRNGAASHRPSSLICFFFAVYDRPAPKGSIGIGTANQPWVLMPMAETLDKVRRRSSSSGNPQWSTNFR